jgi:predicted transposase YdaD
LYLGKYKNLSIEEIRAMINTIEIFDDIHESRAVQQYGQEIAAKAQMQGKQEGKQEGKFEATIEHAVALAQEAGFPFERITEVLRLTDEQIRAVQRKLS